MITNKISMKRIVSKIKEDSEDLLFDMLFKKNNQGIVEPIKGMTLKLMSDGIPMILNEATANMFSNDFTIGNSIEEVRTNKSFREISNEIAMENPFGKNSMFYKEEREILKGQIPKL